ncbi:hypothetical protein DENSPDRAFT_171140 [Dentipellis sp. KUC8613]|nr:hypothetical protein DENSPDRAFT_171140 [Dentipellis sp. KUC8613]
MTRCSHLIISYEFEIDGMIDRTSTRRVVSCPRRAQLRRRYGGNARSECRRRGQRSDLASDSDAMTKDATAGVWRIFCALGFVWATWEIVRVLGDGKAGGSFCACVRFLRSKQRWSGSSRVDAEAFDQTFQISRSIWSC